MAEGPPPLRELVARAVGGDRRALARLVTVFEDRREAAIERRTEAMRLLDGLGVGDAGLVTGITGPPVVGKSTLVSTLVSTSLRVHSDIRISVVAIDPSSTRSGGSLLGDRTRLASATDEARLYFRSQASAGELGGLGPATLDVAMLLRRLFDHVLIETVGVGQSELEVVALADWTWLVLQPLTGDGVQFLKAGVMEVPDLVVLNKCDETRAAARTYHALRSALRLARPTATADTPIVRTSALSGAGVDELAERLEAHRGAAGAGRDARDTARLVGWVRAEWGRRGLARLGGSDGVAAVLAEAGGVYAAQAVVRARLG